MPYKWKDQQKAYHKKYHAKWYKKNKEKLLVKQANRRKEIKEWFAEYKSSLSCIVAKIILHV